MLRACLYGLAALLIGLGVGVVYVGYESAYELLLVPLVILVRTVVLRALLFVAEAFLSWGWNQTFLFLFLLSLPTIWRRTIVRSVLRTRVYVRARWFYLKERWPLWPLYRRVVLASTLFFVICLVIAYAEEAVVLITVLFVRVPFLTPVVMWVRTVVLRFGARVGVIFGIGLFLRKMIGIELVSRLQALLEETRSRYRSKRRAFARKFLVRKKHLGRELAAFSHAEKKEEPHS